MTFKYFCILGGFNLMDKKFQPLFEKLKLPNQVVLDNRFVLAP